MFVIRVSLKVQRQQSAGAGFVGGCGLPGWARHGMAWSWHGTARHSLGMSGQVLAMA